MTICHLQGTGAIELYFYGELDATARADIERHLTACADCRQALEDMRTIRVALANRPDVSTPPGGDWSGFMARLDEALGRGAADPAQVSSRSASAGFAGRYVVYAAAAALVTFVAMSVGYVARSRQHAQESVTTAVNAPADMQPAPAELMPPRAWSPDMAFASLSEQHFERSKLVVYGLANKDARLANADDWAYERQLASALLSDTRLYRLAAEERGMKSVARVMGDLELVLLQTAMSSDHQADTLQQIQSLIRKRDLVTKMDVVATGY